MSYSAWRENRHAAVPPATAASLLRDNPACLFPAFLKPNANPPAIRPTGFEEQILALRETAPGTFPFIHSNFSSAYHLLVDLPHPASIRKREGCATVQITFAFVANEHSGRAIQVLTCITFDTPEDAECFKYLFLNMNPMNNAAGINVWKKFLGLTTTENLPRFGFIRNDARPKAFHKHCGHLAWETFLSNLRFLFDRLHVRNHGMVVPSDARADPAEFDPFVWTDWVCTQWHALDQLARQQRTVETLLRSMAAPFDVRVNSSVPASRSPAEATAAPADAAFTTPATPAPTLLPVKQQIQPPAPLPMLPTVNYPLSDTLQRAMPASFNFGFCDAAPGSGSLGTAYPVPAQAVTTPAAPAPTLLPVKQHFPLSATFPNPPTVHYPAVYSAPSFESAGALRKRTPFLAKALQAARPSTGDVAPVPCATTTPPATSARSLSQRQNITAGNVKIQPPPPATARALATPASSTSISTPGTSVHAHGIAVNSLFSTNTFVNVQVGPAAADDSPVIIGEFSPREARKRQHDRDEALAKRLQAEHRHDHRPAQASTERNLMPEFDSAIPASSVDDTPIPTQRSPMALKPGEFLIPLASVVFLLTGSHQAGRMVQMSFLQGSCLPLDDLHAGAARSDFVLEGKNRSSKIVEIAPVVVGSVTPAGVLQLRQYHGERVTAPSMLAVRLEAEE